MNDSHPVAVHDSVCRNCSAELTGPFCALCGQHAHESAKSLHVLFHDVWHLMTHLDGTIWTTLKLLLLRPGRLTLEYFADHRARYVPPFRLYFIISIAFFGLASLVTPNPTVTRTTDLTAADRAELQADLKQVTPIDINTNGHPLSTEEATSMCNHLAIGVPRIDGRVESACVRQLLDQGKTMMHGFVSMIPKTMLVFLPLMALVMLALYHSPPRYYVEHLVFFLHLQSATFLFLILGMLLTQLGNAVSGLKPVTDFGKLGLFFYFVWYSFTAQRNYYAQKRLRTFFKFAAVVISYLVCLTFAMLGTLVLSALLD